MKLTVGAIRKQLNMTQGQMAKVLNISSVSYALKENGKREFKGSELVKISNVAKVSLDDIKIV